MSIASDMADNMMAFYTGNQSGQTPGLLPQPYYWWEGGALMGALIDYWYYTGDTKWNSIILQGLLFQVGPNNDYMPPNQTMTEGNDDQGFWAMAVLSAAEYNFPNPPASKPQWLALAQAVFNTQAARWDEAQCGGGLRWQIFQWNNGYNYKNSISQACFFNIAARLALYTGNETYALWANRTWDWMIALQFMHEDSYYIYDGAHVETNCTQVVPYQWTYNAGAFLLGAAAMYNLTADNDPYASALWKDRVDGLLSGTHVFFAGADNNIMLEVACERVHLCDLDQQSFKAYLARWMAAATKWAPWIHDTVKPLLDASALAAVQQCTGGDNGRMCGLMWTNNDGVWDGTTGVGQQMAAMEVVLATMIKKLEAPVTSSTGGTSPGNFDAGSSDIGRTDSFTALDMMKPITTADRAGAYILTIIALVFIVGGMTFAFHDEATGRSFGERWKGLREELAPGGVLRVWSIEHLSSNDLRKDGEKEAEGEFHDINLNGPSIPASKLTSKHLQSPAVSISIYSSHTAEFSWTLPRADEYPNEQPWRRAAREGDYAGAIDPNRGNGAGFGIIDTQLDNIPLDPASSLTGPGITTVDNGSRNLWMVSNSSRTLMRKNLKLEKKPLPGTPGLGKRQQGLGDRKL
ncbi:Mannan endo-1,6-alpha-mannosidase DCW1 [Cytospora mali]|uniref:mannan endo-1,6-alpha-mannosidase n=1 Tax=Cytospora mali TaxID=578113 RepID=A0A194V837_CYTMA|nr:Mannan endo-1,6-alpha-mannosidase DCW1 [Valsa mali var. pyri (nom. inval.)]